MPDTHKKIIKDDLRPGWTTVFTHFKTSDEPPYLAIIFQLIYENLEPPYGDVSEISAV